MHIMDDAIFCDECMTWYDDDIGLLTWWCYYVHIYV